MKKTLLIAAMAALAMGASLWGQTINVTSPGAGNDWCLGSTHTITWTSSGVAGNVMIVLRPADPPMSDPVLTIVASTANDGSHSWSIPGSGLAAGTYEVRVRTVTTDPFVFGDSANFTISSCPAPSASINVTSPGAGNDWCLGSSHAITWTSSGVSGNVMIVLRPADPPMADPVLTIVASTANDGSYSWSIPGSGLAAGTYEVRVRTVTTDPFVFGDSAIFKISRCSNLKPDFELLGIPVNGDPTGNNLNSLSVIIKNNGDSYEGAISFRIIGMDRLMGGKFLLDTRKSFNMKLTKGEKVTKRILQGISWPIDVCNVSFGIIVDPDNLITESNETNNSFDRTIYKGEVLGKNYCDIRILPKIIQIGKASLRPVPDGGSIVLAHDRNDILLTLRNNCSETKTLDFSIVYDWTFLLKDGVNKVIWNSKITLKPCEVKPLRFTGLEIPKKKEFKTLALEFTLSW